MSLIGGGADDAASSCQPRRATTSLDHRTVAIALGQSASTQEVGESGTSLAKKGQVPEARRGRSHLRRP